MEFANRTCTQKGKGPCWTWHEITLMNSILYTVGMELKETIDEPGAFALRDFSRIVFFQNTNDFRSPDYDCRNLLYSLLRYHSCIRCVEFSQYVIGSSTTKRLYGAMKHNRGLRAFEINVFKELPSELLDAWGTLTRLEKLVLVCTNVPCQNQFAALLARLPLKWIELVQINRGDEPVDLLRDVARDPRHLQTLRLESCVVNHYASGLCQILRHKRCVVKDLTLKCRWRDAAAVAFANALTENQTLRRLNFDGSQFPPSFVERLSDYIASNPEELESLVLSRCALTDTSVRTIARGLSTNRTLLNVDFSYNNLSHATQSALLRALTFHCPVVGDRKRELLLCNYDSLDPFWGYDLHVMSVEKPTQASCAKLGGRTLDSIRTMKLFWDDYLYDTCKILLKSKSLRKLHVNFPPSDEIASNFITLADFLKETTSVREFYIDSPCSTTCMATSIFKALADNRSVVVFRWPECVIDDRKSDLLNALEELFRKNKTLIDLSIGVHPNAHEKVARAIGENILSFDYASTYRSFPMKEVLGRNLYRCYRALDLVRDPYCVTANLPVSTVAKLESVLFTSYFAEHYARVVGDGRLPELLKRYRQYVHNTQ